MMLDLHHAVTTSSGLCLLHRMGTEGLCSVCAAVAIGAHMAYINTDFGHRPLFPYRYCQNRQIPLVA